MGKVKTFGEVDRRSLEQLERCMAAGDADYGVLCADHHPGYSQPIGGGIAYEGHVSPSGVGYAVEWYRGLLMTPQVMAFIATIGVLGYATDTSIRALTRRFTPWAATEAVR